MLLAPSRDANLVHDLSHASDHKLLHVGEGGYSKGCPVIHRVILSTHDIQPVHISKECATAPAPASPSLSMLPCVAENLLTIFNLVTTGILPDWEMPRLVEMCMGLGGAQAIE